MLLLVLIVAVAVGLAGGIATAEIATQRKLEGDAGLYFALGFLLPPVGIIVAALKQPASQSLSAAGQPARPASP